MRWSRCRICGKVHREGFFAAEPLEDEERICEAHEGDVAVSPGVGAPSEVVQAEFVFELPVILLDPRSLERSYSGPTR